MCGNIAQIAREMAAFKAAWECGGRLVQQFQKINDFVGN
jgi:hypothetical protein